MIAARDNGHCPRYKRYNMTIKEMAKILHVGERSITRRKTIKERREFVKKLGYKLIVFENNKRHYYRIEKIDSPD